MCLESAVLSTKREEYLLNSSLTTFNKAVFCRTTQSSSDVFKNLLLPFIKYFNYINLCRLTIAFYITQNSIEYCRNVMSRNSSDIEIERLRIIIAYKY